MYRSYRLPILFYNFNIWTDLMLSFFLFKIGLRFKVYDFKIGLINWWFPIAFLLLDHLPFTLYNNFWLGFFLLSTLAFRYLRFIIYFVVNFKFLLLLFAFFYLSLDCQVMTVCGWIIRKWSHRRINIQYA